MKHFRKMLSVMLTLAMVATMMVSLASAATATYTISVKDGDTHTYDVYQIFTADVDSEGTLTNVAFGTNGKAEDGKTLDDALAAIEALDKDATDAEKLAVITKYCTGEAFGTTKAGAPASVPSGYYLISDASMDLTDKDDAHTTFIVKVVSENIDFARKDVKPSVDKQVWDETADAETGHKEGWGESADHAINETFQFKLTATLPADTDYASYETYKLVFTDTMSAGVTFEQIDSVKIGTTDITDYVLAGVAAGDAGKTWTLTVADAKSYGVDLTKGTTVEVIYSAHLNEAAYVNTATGTTTNKNTVSLQYSNNPAVSGNGTTTGDNDLGKTTEDSVYVFTYQVNATKVEKGTTTTLEGAKFQLNDADGSAVELYVNNGVYYVFDSEINAGTTSTTEIVTAADGTFVIKGLDTGSYTLVETEAPEGYNKCDDVTVKVSATHVEAADGNSATTTLSQDSTLSLTIEDAKGSTLPTTGGMGTTILYIIGGILVIGAGVALITKKRVENER